MRARLVLTFLLTLFLAGSSAVVAGTASAHDVLISTTPAKDTAVATPPSDVLLVFNEPVLAKGSRVEVTGPGGRVDSGDAAFVDTNVTQPLKAGLPAGKYDVLWRVTSSDGHPISGKFSFTATAGAPAASTTSAPTAPASSSAAAPSVSAAPAVPASADDESDGINPWVYVGGAALVLALGGAWLASRRRTTPPAE